jgi:prepilin-type N-terminal cleavage/methylation domain-containing protein
VTGLLRRARPISLQRVRTSGDDGFTMVEVLVTMIIVSTALLALFGMQVQAASTISLAKERTQATGFANQTLEQIRALPWATVKLGLKTADPSLSGDPNVSGNCATSCSFVPSYGGTSEPIVLGNQATAPLFPRVTTNVLDANTYTTRTYVSRPSDASLDAVWVTVVVTWDSNAKSQQDKTVSVRSLVFSSTFVAGAAE